MRGKNTTLEDRPSPTFSQINRGGMIKTILPLTPRTFHLGIHLNTQTGTAGSNDMNLNKYHSLHLSLRWRQGTKSKIRVCICLPAKSLQSRGILARANFMTNIFGSPFELINTLQLDKTRPIQS